MSGRPANVFRVDRREFLRLTGLSAGVLVLGCRVPSDDETLGGAADARFDPNVFISLDGTGKVTLVAHRSEMGQGSRTSLPLVMADEMEADWDRVEIVQALGDAKYGNQNTDGSRSVRRGFRRMREAGATARHMLVAAAAAAWGVEAAECEAREHRVHHRPSGRSLGYGALAERAAALPVPDPAELELKPRERFRYIGRSVPVVDLEDFVTGKAVYGIDAELPGMLHASIERCPAVGGRPVAWNEKAALAVPGVRKIVQIPAVEPPPAFKPLGGLAVLAENTWAAIQGRRALAVEWDLGPNGAYDSKAYRRQLEATAAGPCDVVRERGDVDAALERAKRRIVASYYTPHLAQAPMEPPAALARVEGDRCEVWACTQAPQSAQRTVAEVLGLESGNVTVHVTLLGGGFGRKSKPDYVAEAALLAREAGRPVKVTWTREDDVRHGYFHSVASQRLEAALDEAGRPTAWLHRTVFPSIGATFDPTVRRAGAGELGLGFVDLPFDIPNLRLENGEARAHVRIGWLRSVANVYHAFAIGSFADELAHAAGADPKDYLLELLGEPRHLDPAADGAEYQNYGDPLETYPIDIGRARRVVERVAEEAGWSRPLPDGHGLGIAVHRSFLAYVAAVVHVSTTPEGKIRVEEVHSAIDAGTIVHRDRVEAQLEGAAIFGLSLALSGEITARAGAGIEQGNFDSYPLLRMPEAPRTIGAHVIESDAPPAGVGEPGVPPIAPALANAVFAATGRRIRELPLSKAGIV